MSRKLHLDADRRFGKLVIVALALKHKVTGHTQYKCQCDCGNTVTVKATSLIAEHTVSCGCKRKDNLKDVNEKRDRGELDYPMRKYAVPNEKTKLAVIRSYREGAGLRKFSWSLTVEQCSELFASNCFYCGAVPGNVKNSSGGNRNGKHFPFVYNGIDRIDSLRGYESDNVAACCAICNRAKGTLTAIEFRTWLFKAYRYMIQNGVLQEAACAGGACEIT